MTQNQKIKVTAAIVITGIAGFAYAGAASVAMFNVNDVAAILLTVPAIMYIARIWMDGEL